MNMTKRQKIFSTLLMTALLCACGGGGGGGSSDDDSVSAPGTTPFDDTPRFAYVINKSVIGGYVVDPENGNLIPKGHSQRFFESAPVDIAASPDGRFLYFCDLGGFRAIKRYDINPQTGTHVYATGKEFAVGAAGARQLLIHPSGKFLFYRMNSFTAEPITTLALDAASGDMSLAGQTAPIDSISMHLAPDGRFLYTTDTSGSLDRDIQTFAVAADGSLTAVDADPSTAGLQLQTFADSSPPGFNPANGDIYLVDVSGGGSINRYRRETTTGLLSLVDITPIENATTTVFATWQDGLLVEPKGRFGYVRLDGNLIAGFSIDPGDGSLAPIDYDPFTAGIQHLDFGGLANSTRVVSFEPSGRFVYFGLAGATGTLEKYGIDQATGMLTRSATRPELDRILALDGLVDGIVFTNRTGVAPPQPSFAYSRQSGAIGIHRVDPATGMLTDVGTFAVPGYNHLQVDPAQTFIYVGERSNSFTRVRIDPATGELSDREDRANTLPSPRQGPLFDPHNRFAVQTRYQGNGMDFMEVVTGPPGGLGTPYSGVQFSEDPYTVTNSGGASAVRPNSRQIYSTGLVTNTPTLDWKLRMFNLDITPVGWDRVDAQPATPGHQDFSISTRAVDTVVEPLGRYLLTLEPQSLIGGFTNTDNLAVYELQWISGTPTIRQALTVPLVRRNHITGSNPLHIALDPRGRFVYVPTRDGIAGFAFTRNPSGPALEVIDIDPATPGFNLLQPAGGNQRLAIDPTGQWLYSGTEGFSINQATGALESIGIVSSAPIVQVIGRL